jgi:WD40 repeat protein
VQESLAPAFEIVAHSRFLSSIQMHHSKPWLLTTAQDGTLAVWKLPAGQDGSSVRVLASKTWKNCMLVGGAFVGEEMKVAVSAYSSENLRVYNINAQGG